MLVKSSEPEFRGPKTRSGICQPPISVFIDDLTATSVSPRMQSQKPVWSLGKTFDCSRKDVLSFRVTSEQVRSSWELQSVVIPAWHPV